MTRSEQRFWNRFVLPGGLWLTALFAAPLLLAVALSFASVDEIGRPEYSWTLDNYRTVFDPQFTPVLLRTVVLAGLATLGCLLIGYPLAYYIARFGGRAKTILLALVVIPFAVNYLIKIYSWITILGRRGILNGFFGTEIQILNTNEAVIIGLVYGYITFMILPIYAALDRMDPHLIEAARDLYSGKTAAFFYVTLPYSMPGVIAGCMLVFLPSMGDFVSAQLLGGSKVVMVGNLVQQQFFQSTNWPLGAAFIVTLIAIVLAGFTIVTLLMRRFGRGIEFGI